MIHTEILNLITKKSLGLTLVLSTATIAFAQEKQQFYGKITDQHNNNIPYASVTFENKSVKENKALYSDATLTDDNGKYSVNLTSGTYEITIEAIDFKKYTLTKVINNNFNLGTIQIQAEQQLTNSKTKEIEGVTLTASTKPVKVDIDKKTYDVKSDLTAIGGNLQDVLQNVPSVSVDPDGTVSLRGSANVKFLVNGKPSALLGIDDGANALQAIPADQIEKIEVITNPSSKFDASGTAGILNIILKKTAKTGFNGSIVGSLGLLPRTSLNTNLSWRKGNLTWFLNGGGGYTESKGKNWTDATYQTPQNFDKTDPTAGNFLRSYQISESKNYSKNYNASTGLVYDINKNTSVNASITVRKSDSDSNSPVNYTYYMDNNTQKLGERNAIGNSSNKGIQADLGLDKKIDSKGQNLSLALSLQRNETNGSTSILQDNRNIQLEDANNQNTLNKSLVGKIDYELPLGEKSMFNAGYKIDYNQNDYDFAVSEKKQGETNFSINENLKDYNNTTNYKEVINAVYAQFKSKIGNLGYQIGLRNEASNINLNYVNVSGKDNIENKTKNNNNLFPSVFLSYSIAKDNQFLLNYSRRIDRPRTMFLAPFMSYNDNQNIFKGNPDLNPAYIDSFEFGYSISKKKYSLNPTVYFRQENDDVKMTLVYDENKSQFVSQPKNLGYDQRIGLDLNYTYDPFSWWKLMGEVDVYRYKTTGDFYYATNPNDPNNKNGYISYAGNGISSRLRLSSTFKISKSFNLQLMGNYRASQKEGANDSKPMYFMNLGATKTIWKGNGTIAFNIQDIFNTRYRNVIQTGLGYSRESFMQWQPRQFSISLTYRFKQGEKVEQPKRKRDINNNEGGGEEMPPM